MSHDKMPPAGHTDDLGNWHWGSAGARLGRISAEENRRDGVAAEKAADERAAHVSYEDGKEAQRQEAGQTYQETLTAAPEPQSLRDRARAAVDREIWESVEREPSPTIEAVPDHSRER